MIRPTSPAILLAAFLAAALLLGPMLDGIPDQSAEWDTSHDLQVAIQQATARNRFEQAAQKLCGPQSPWEELPDGSVQCRTRYGKPTITVKVSP